MATHYEVLGVACDASAREIRLAFKRRAIELHPDKVRDPHKVAATSVEFLRVRDAHETLSNATRRDDYDRLLSAAPAAATPRAHTAVDPNGTFSAFFRGGPAAASGGVHNIACTLEELARGCKKTVVVGGTRCVVNVPAGTHDAATIRLRAPAATFRIETLAHDVFTRYANDLHATVALALRSALLPGMRFRAPTLLGTPGHVDVALAHIARPGSEQRIAGQGMPVRPGGRRGDLVVHFHVVFPDTLTKQQQETVARVLPRMRNGEDATVAE